MLARLKTTEFIVLQCQRCGKIKMFERWITFTENLKTELEKRKHKILTTLCSRCSPDNDNCGRGVDR